MFTNDYNFKLLQTYGGCQCSNDEVASSGMCVEQCGTLPIYATVFFVMTFCGALGEVPATVLLLRYLIRLFEPTLHLQISGEL